MSNEMIEEMVEEIMRQLGGSNYNDYASEETREKYRKMLQENEKKESEK